MLNLLGDAHPHRRHESVRDRCVLSNARSQWGEDLMLLPFLRRASGWRPGIFVELGALDGVSLSNTHVLERCYNWTGLLVEANPANFANLARSPRKVAKMHSAVCNATNGSTVLMTEHGENVAAQVSEMSAKFRKRFQNVNQPAQTVSVPCRPLARLMSSAGFDAAHFLSLDVEGSEERVLETVDPACFAVVLVEMDGLDPRRDARVHATLTQAGLVYQKNLGVKNGGVYLRPNKLLLTRPDDACGGIGGRSIRSRRARARLNA